MWDDNRPYLTPSVTTYPLAFREATPIAIPRSDVDFIGLFISMKANTLYRAVMKVINLVNSPKVFSDCADK